MMSAVQSWVPFIAAPQSIAQEIHSHLQDRGPEVGIWFGAVAEALVREALWRKATLIRTDECLTQALLSLRSEVAVRAYLAGVDTTSLRLADTAASALFIRMAGAYDLERAYQMAGESPAELITMLQSRAYDPIAERACAILHSSMHSNVVLERWRVGLLDWLRQELRG